MAKTPRITVYESRIERAFLPGGTVYGNVRRVGKDHERFAKNLAPKRTGQMAQNIRMAITPFGKYQFRYTVNTRTDYAIYTLKGTTGPIFPSNSKLLWVRPKPYSWYSWNRTKGWGGRTPRISVDGQTGDDWLKKSLYLTFKKHRLL